MSRKPDLQEPPPRLPSEKAEEVLAELERVLANPLFRASRRCQILLRRIIEQTITGDFDSLKERWLGVEVFDRRGHRAAGSAGWKRGRDAASGRSAGRDGRRRRGRGPARRSRR